MLSSFLNAVFGCAHRRTSFPVTPSKSSSRGMQLAADGSRRGTYVVCLDCGKEFDYNWAEMRIGHAVPVTGTGVKVESLPATNR